MEIKLKILNTENVMTAAKTMISQTTITTLLYQGFQGYKTSK